MIVLNRWQASGGAGVLGIVADFDGDTYRAVYSIRFAKHLYVLHAFQKKSRSGIGTPQSDMRVIQSRLKLAEQEEQARNRAEQER